MGDFEGREYEYVPGSEREGWWEEDGGGESAQKSI